MRPWCWKVFDARKMEGPSRRGITCSSDWWLDDAKGLRIIPRGSQNSKRSLEVKGPTRVSEPASHLWSQFSPDVLRPSCLSIKLQLDHLLFSAANKRRRYALCSWLLKWVSTNKFVLLLTVCISS